MLDIEVLKKEGLTVVMYHYVRDKKRENTKYLKSLEINDFKRQLDKLQRYLEPMSAAGLARSLKDGCFEKDQFLLTFDDSLRDHYIYVFPELKKRNLTGVFFINPSVYLHQKPLNVHKLHVMQSSLGDLNFLEVVADYVTKKNLNYQVFESKNLYRYDNSDLTKMKKYLNYELDYTLLDTLVDDLWAHFGEDHKINDWYCSMEQLNEMHDSGMIVANHGLSHKVYSRLSNDEIMADIELSTKFIENEFKSDIKLFGYPFGHKETFNADTVFALKTYGYDGAFSTTRGSNSGRIIDRFAIKRYDTKDLI